MPILSGYDKAPLPPVKARGALSVGGMMRDMDPDTTIHPADQERRLQTVERYAEAMHRTVCTGTDWRACSDHRDTGFDRFAAAAMAVAQAEQADDAALRIEAAERGRRTMEAWRA